MRLVIMAAGLALAGMTSHALVQECDPNAFLRADVLAYSSDERVFISDVRSRLASRQSADDTSIGITRLRDGLGL